jgi:RsiW-degrading membrane proteinase PrsW (M82 family)
MPEFETLAYALIGGVVPSLIWLYFLLKEDSRCPEPWWHVCLAFFAGMLAVPVVLVLEHYFKEYAIVRFAECGGTTLCTPMLLAWATIEETIKYAFAAVVLIYRRALDQAVHMVIFMLTVALGFAAVENILFLVDPYAGGNLFYGLVTNNLRFLGSTLLHVVASSAIGFALAFSYNARPVVRALSAAIGLILAIALHAVFNFFIINEDGSQTLLAFFVAWTGIIVFFAAFEVLKYIRYRNLPKNTCDPL